MCSTLLLVALAAFGAWWVLLKLRLAPQRLVSVYCTICIFLLVCGSAVVTWFIDLFRRAGLLTRAQSGDVCSVACRVVFRSAFVANPQLTIHIDDSEVRWADVPPRTCMLINHTSFLDALVFTAHSPFSFIMTSRTLMKASLRKLPIFGGVFDRVGHFPVHFKSEEGGAFSVDKDRQMAVAARVQSHVKRDGRLTIFPEGQMNTAPSQLMPFRHGSFSTIIENNMEMYYCIMWGNNTVWPAKSATPAGGPLDLFIKIGRIGFAKEGEDSTALAARAQGIMQAAVADVERKAAEKAKSK